MATKKIWKITPELQFQWLVLAKKLAKEYPSNNHGYRNAENHRTVYAIIAKMYSVHPRTVYRHLSPGTLAGGEREKRYDLRYHHLIRHLDTVLPALYNGNSDLSLEEMSGRIQSHVGIKMQEGTLEKLLVRYGGEPRGSPVLRTELGTYRLNPSYYSSRTAPAYQETAV